MTEIFATFHVKREQNAQKNEKTFNIKVSYNIASLGEPCI